jgi:hypothetical protein
MTQSRWRNALAALAAITLCASSAGAQTAVGVKAGPGSARFAGSTLDHVEWKGGIAGGVFVTYGMIDELSFQSELFYQRKGSTIRRFATDQVSTSVNLDYIEVAAMLRLDVPVGNALLLYGIAGPGVGLNVRCSADDGGTAELECRDIDMAVRRVDFSMIGGGGIGVRLERATIFAEGRLGIGLVTIDADAGWQRTNEAGALLAGVSIPLGRAPANAMQLPAPDPAYVVR